MLILAFDTATDVATSALVADGEVLGERTSRAVTLLEDVDALLRQAGARTRDVEALAVGIGPGSFTGVRVGLATARGLALALDLPVAGVSTLDALVAGAPGAVPVGDARRREVFALVAGEARVLRPDELRSDPGTPWAGDGAARSRTVLGGAARVAPPSAPGPCSRGPARSSPRTRTSAISRARVSTPPSRVTSGRPPRSSRCT